MKLLITSVFILIFSLASFADCNSNRQWFHHLPVNERVQRWNDHLLDYEAEHIFELSPQQMDVIEHARTWILPLVYVDRGRDISAWRTSLRDQFTPEEGAEIFESLEGEEDPEDDLLANRSCTCSTWWTFCTMGNCTASSRCAKVYECGPFWSMQCDGKCMFM